jgi:hypothetical protein
MGRLLRRQPSKCTVAVSRRYQFSLNTQTKRADHARSYAVISATVGNPPLERYQRVESTECSIKLVFEAERMATLGMASLRLLLTHPLDDSVGG